MRLRPTIAAPLFAGLLFAGPLFVALALALAAAPLLMLGTPARAAPVEVDIDKGDVQPLPIAVAPLAGGDARTAGLGADIGRVIDANLQRSGFFKPLDPTSFVDGNGGDVDVQPKFADWRAINAHALVNGRVNVDADGRLRVDFRLWDTFNEQQLLGLQFTATPEDWRRIAHKISDAVYKKLTGEDGYFDSRVVFVAESGSRAHRIKRLAIMDQDGANPSFLTDGSTQVLTPRFSASGQEITYMALSDSAARVYLFNIETGRRESLGSFSGMVFAPRFSPDGNRVAFSVVKDGNADIYVMDLRSRGVLRLTTEPSIDTSPSFSPDGGRLVFNSDRGGSPQLYVMGADGSGPHRISFGSGRYTAPVWSPKGDYIAATKQTGSSFHIVVMRPDGSEERSLTSSYLDEGPTWAPNGRVIMFSRESAGRGSRLWTVDISGRNLQEEPYTAAASDPAWSPLLR